MLACGLKTIDELDEIEEKERLEKETERTAQAVMPQGQQAADPFARLNVSLLPLKV
jgi:hypothetical protein